MIKRIGLTTLALSLMLSLPAFAQGTNPASSPSMPMGGEPGQGMHGGKMGGGPGMFRKEAMKMRQEEEALDIARDKLLDKCMFASKDQAASCTKEREELRVRAEKFRADRKTMHEKMETMRKERMEMREQRREDMQNNKMMPLRDSTKPATPETPVKQ